MSLERTLSIIKPDAVAAGHTGAVIDRFEKEGFRILGIKRLHLSTGQAERFYTIHRERPFFASLTSFMSEGPVVVMVLEAEGAIAKLRDLMGVTDPARARDGSLRKQYGLSIERNAVHGSDALESAGYEITYFFSQLELT
ncbi:MAG: nucleoside-diphosphate kinase [Acidobacteriota bacterium]